ncbi:MAG: RsmE family RNA methyltransferase [Eubacteriales bacterium]|nr:RsmE family RNA methyltransferase [Eubacteriales bacterium]
MHSFFIAPGLAAGQQGFLDAEESAHAARVLRLREGEQARLIDGEGHAFLGTLTKIDPKQTAFTIDSPAPSRESIARVTVYQGLPKADKMEWITQKLTELGVCRIVPVEMRFCVAKAGKAGKDARLVRIAREAVKQCGRSACPKVEQAMPFKSALADMAQRELMLMPWESAQGRTLAAALAQAPQARDVGVLIGPEGGISPEEAQSAIDAGAQAVTLGERILRTETASIASAAVVLSLLEAAQA